VKGRWFRAGPRPQETFESRQKKTSREKKGAGRGFFWKNHSIKIKEKQFFPGPESPNRGCHPSLKTGPKNVKSRVPTKTIRKGGVSDRGKENQNNRWAAYPSPHAVLSSESPSRSRKRGEPCAGRFSIIGSRWVSTILDGGKGPTPKSFGIKGVVGGITSIRGSARPKTIALPKSPLMSLSTGGEKPLAFQDLVLQKSILWQPRHKAEKFSVPPEPALFPPGWERFEGVVRTNSITRPMACIPYQCEKGDKERGGFAPRAFRRAYTSVLPGGPQRGVHSNFDQTFFQGHEVFQNMGRAATPREDNRPPEKTQSTGGFCGRKDQKPGKKPKRGGSQGGTSGGPCLWRGGKLEGKREDAGMSRGRVAFQGEGGVPTQGPRLNQRDTKTTE